MTRWSKESPAGNRPSRRYSGETTNRQLEPLHLVHTMSHRYLLAHSLDAADLRTFRVDRLSEGAGHRQAQLPAETSSRRPARICDDALSKRMAPGDRDRSRARSARHGRPWIEPPGEQSRFSQSFGCLEHAGTFPGSGGRSPRFEGADALLKISAKKWPDLRKQARPHPSNKF
ncbi:WYL domain-containing protein [Cryobacterium sp. Hb1]|uniref:WYL domain-containing protein n=1 Tax=Cryobacterium sp. Hb1 TaxID=1259147 RepID=UPI00351A0F61